MFMRIVMQVSGQVTALFTRLYSSVMTLLLNSASKLRALIIQTYRSVLTLVNRLVRTELNTKALRANLTTLAQSTRAVLTLVKAKAIQTGSLLLTTVRKISPLALILPLRKNVKPAGSTKLARSRSKGSKAVQTRMAAQSTQGGLKLEGLVKQHLQRAKPASKKGK